MSQFDIGNVYSLVSSQSKTKIFYIAISNLVLITYSKDRFSRFTTKRTKGHELEGISVDDLVDFTRRDDPRERQDAE